MYQRDGVFQDGGVDGESPVVRVEYATDTNGSNLTQWKVEHSGASYWQQYNGSLSGVGTAYFKMKNQSVYLRAVSENGQYSEWRKIELKYTISYDSNGGSTYNHKDYAIYGANINLPTTDLPTKTGYTFDGWTWDSSNLSLTLGGGVKVYGNATIKASWTPNKYRLTYNSNDGSGITDYSDSYYDSEWTVDKSFTRSGFELLGFADSSSATTATYKNGDKIKVTGNKTIYAVWKELPKVTLSYTGDASTTSSTKSLKATVTPTTYKKGVTWTSSDSTIASVSSSGTVTRKKEGTVTITATSNDDSRAKATATITIIKTGTKKCTGGAGYEDDGSEKNPETGGYKDYKKCKRCGYRFVCNRAGCPHEGNGKDKTCFNQIGEHKNYTTYTMTCTIP